MSVQLHVQEMRADVYKSPRWPIWSLFSLVFDSLNAYCYQPIFHTEGDQYAILCLKQSKTDVEHTVVQIILAARGEPTCTVSALRRLFVQDPRPGIFRLSSSAFSRQNVVSILKKQITKAGLAEEDFSGHSFRKGAAQHAADHDILNESIQ